MAPFVSSPRIVRGLADAALTSPSHGSTTASASGDSRPARDSGSDRVAPPVADALEAKWASAIDAATD
jgi:hypothetical protein